MNSPVKVHTPVVGLDGKSKPFISQDMRTVQLTTELAKALANLPRHEAFEGVSKDDIIRLIRRKSIPIRTLDDGEMFIRQGDIDVHRFYAVIAGNVAVIQNKKKVAVIQEGNIVGYHAYMTEDPRDSDVVADGDAIILEINEDLLEDESAIMRILGKNVKRISVRRFREQYAVMQKIKAENEKLQEHVNKHPELIAKQCQDAVNAIAKDVGENLAKYY